MFQKYWNINLSVSFCSWKIIFCEFIFVCWISIRVSMWMCVYVFVCVFAIQDGVRTNTCFHVCSLVLGHFCSRNLITFGVRPCLRMIYWRRTSDWQICETPIKCELCLLHQERTEWAHMRNGRQLLGRGNVWFMFVVCVYSTAVGTHLHVVCVLFSFGAVFCFLAVVVVNKNELCVLECEVIVWVNVNCSGIGMSRYTWLQLAWSSSCTMLVYVNQGFPPEISIVWYLPQAYFSDFY